MAVEVCKTKESLNITKVVGFWPVGDGGYFALIHANATGLDDHFEVLDVVVVKLAFLSQIFPITY